MSAHIIYDSAPLGNVIRCFDGTAKPLARFTKKVAAWESRNGLGRMVSKEPPQARSTHSSPAYLSSGRDMPSPARKPVALRLRVSAPQLAREMMSAAGFPESLEVEERREGLISYIDRIDVEGHNAIAEAIEFECAHRLFSESGGPDFASCATSDRRCQGEDVLRRLLEGIVLQARSITPNVPPLPAAQDNAFR